MAQPSCCLSGFTWDGTPTGSETTLASNVAYISSHQPADAAIMVIADLFGWTFVNERLLCDHYAVEADATVYMPDFFGGEVIDAAIVGEPKRWGEIDLEAWHKRNAKEVRWNEIESCAKALKAKYKKVGVVGYCYGGWSSFRLGSAEHTPRLVDCISAAHPTWLTKEEIDNIGVPVQVIAPEHDRPFTPELKKYFTDTLPTKGLPYDYQYFPGVVHGFATRGKIDEPGERAAMLRAKRAQMSWMREFLHGDGKW